MELSSVGDAGRAMLGLGESVDSGRFMGGMLKVAERDLECYSPSFKKPLKYK